VKKNIENEADRSMDFVYSDIRSHMQNKLQLSSTRFAERRAKL